MPSFRPENAQGKPFTDESFVAEKAGSEPATTRAGKKKETEEAEGNGADLEQPGSPGENIADGTSNTILPGEE